MQMVVLRFVRAFRPCRVRKGRNQSKARVGMSEIAQ